MNQQTIERIEIEFPQDDESGFGVLETAQGNLPLKKLNVHSVISDLKSKTIVKQEFVNSCDEPIEATYIFPMPGRDAVTGFVMKVGDRTIDGILKERATAREEYDQAIAKGHRAAIAEENRSETFSMRVGNIPAGETVSIELTLVSLLPVSGGEAMFRFPLVVAPRYISGSPLSRESSGSGTVVDTDRVPDASHITPPVLLPGFPNPVELAVTVDFELPANTPASQWLSGIRSTLHTVLVDETQLENRNVVRLELKPGERLNRDFILRFPVSKNETMCSLELAQPTTGTDSQSVFALTLVPPTAETDTDTTPRDIVFLLDRSGSMSGWKMVAARRAVARMVDSMRDQDRFSVLAFDTSVEHAPNSEDSLRSGTDRNRWQAVQWISTIQQRGGTEIEQAIKSALKILDKHSSAEREAVVVLITDGQIGAEDATLRTIGKHPGYRFFTLGIDRSVNHGFLSRVSTMTGGTSEVVESESQLDEVMDRFNREIGTPLVTDLKIECVSSDGISLDQLTPRKGLDLFDDRPVTIYGRVDQSANVDFEIRVSGFLPCGNQWTQTAAARTGNHSTLMALWGRSHIRDLEDLHASGRNETNVEAKIVAASLESNVLSRFTAYVAVDRSAVVTDGQQPHSITQAVEHPEGWPTKAPMMVRSSKKMRRPALGRTRSAVRPQSEDLAAPACPSPQPEIAAYSTPLSDSEMPMMGGAAGPPTAPSDVELGSFGVSRKISKGAGSTPKKKLPRISDTVSKDYVSELLELANAQGFSAIAIQKQTDCFAVNLDKFGQRTIYDRVTGQAMQNIRTEGFALAGSEQNHTADSGYFGEIKQTSNQWVLFCLPGQPDALFFLNVERVAAKHRLALSLPLAKLLSSHPWLTDVIENGCNCSLAPSQHTAWIAILEKLIPLVSNRSQKVLVQVRDILARSAVNSIQVTLAEIVSEIDSVGKKRRPVKTKAAKPDVATPNSVTETDKKAFWK
ncbi:MAG: VIT domain-containing protein [Mariniblastus sp.]